LREFKHSSNDTFQAFTRIFHREKKLAPFFSCDAILAKQQRCCISLGDEYTIEMFDLVR